MRQVCQINTLTILSGETARGSTPFPRSLRTDSAIASNAASIVFFSTAIGGLIFQWSDGWWKTGQTERLDQQDTTASWANGAYPFDFVEGQNNMNEEWFGITANVMSLFGYIIVVGVVVDDAIITGENVYQKQKEGLSATESTILGHTK